MNLIVKKPFSWAHQGTQIESFEVGQTIETEDADLIAVATSEGWAAKDKAKSKPEGDATSGPENAA
jgi:hypothetical protein